MGHRAGDEILKGAADCILEVYGPVATCYRIGGDEFVMIMRGGTLLSAERKLKEWEGELEKVQKTTKIHISASAGYAAGVGCDLRGIIKLADEQMYESKRRFYENSGN